MRKHLHRTEDHPRLRPWRPGYGAAVFVAIAAAAAAVATIGPYVWAFVDLVTWR